MNDARERMFGDVDDFREDLAPESGSTELTAEREKRPPDVVGADSTALRVKDVLWDWFTIQACVAAGLVALTGYFTFISTSTWRKCTGTLSVEFRNTSGREEVVRSFLRCTFGREHGKGYRPWKMGDFSVLFVRISTLAYFGEVIFHQLSAWHASKHRKWRTKLAVQSFAGYYIVYFVMLCILGYHSQYSQLVCMSCFGVLFYCGATSKEFWSTKGLSWIYTYVVLMAVFG